MFYTFVETRLFTRLADQLLGDESLMLLQEFLSLHPHSGPVIPRSGGIRKLRWKSTGRGKRGGFRVIYYLRTRQGEIWLLTVYDKSETQNIAPGVLRNIKEEIDGRQ